MATSFSELEDIFKRTREALNEFKDIITPVIEKAEDEHERLYWHHIYEEEDHRFDRLEQLLPKLDAISSSESKVSPDSTEFVHLLQDISLEKFGLHNFLEHLDLSLYTFKDTEFEQPIQALRDLTAEDYQQSKRLLETLNEEFDTINLNASIPTDEKEEIDANLKVESYSQPDNEAVLADEPEMNSARPKLTVGSLKKS
ncbi:IMEF encapsulin system ferritin-like cargo protein [Bacillus marinisedimentorum]|uniref:IMEF encapsulin system ferritin-like cargo protein n=1 Tax=Bacillus marinisedimentorum TaxID=1821260 RepID=UPI0008726563|nr:IMEF encapsulin system ferritin-like cargo protein [Bacillus marinisedimentorum]